MTVQFRVRNLEDQSHDNCGNTTHAVLMIDTISIPLCVDCLEELFEQIDNYRNTIHCNECRHYIPSRWGYSYSGSCRKEAGEDIPDNMIGYKCAKDFFETCPNAERKEG